MAFDAFLAGYRFEGRNLRASSFVVYRGMFMRLHEWLEQQDKTLFSLNEKLINEFLNSRTLSAESRHRYLLLYTTLLAHLADFKGAQDNLARALLLEQEAPERENPEWLTAAEAQAFLTTAAPGSGWKQLRNRALAHTVLGAGLHSSECVEPKTFRLKPKTSCVGNNLGSAEWSSAFAGSPCAEVCIDSNGSLARRKNCAGPTWNAGFSC